MADIKISELEPTTDLEGLFTIGSDKNNLSKKVSLQFLKDAANYANEQGDYAKQAGDTVNGNVGVSDYPEFSASKSYVIGDIVRYNGVLYAFTANHAASAWNGNDVKATSINAITSGKLTELESEVNGFKLDIQNSATTVKSNTQLILGDSYNLSNLANSQVRVRSLDASGNVVETLGYIPENTTRTIVAKTSHASLEFYCSAGVNVVIESQKGLAKTIEKLESETKSQIESQNANIIANANAIKNISLSIDGVDEHIVFEGTTSKRKLELLLNVAYEITNNKSAEVRIRTISEDGNAIETLAYVSGGKTNTIKITQPYWGIDFYCSDGIDVLVQSETSVNKSLAENEKSINILTQELTGVRKEYESASTSYKIPYIMYKGMTYIVTNNGNASMSCYSLDENLQEADVFSVTMGTDGSRQITPNEDVFGIGGYCSTGVNLVIELAESYNSRIENVESLIDGLPSNDILSVNPKSEYDNLLYNAVRGAFGNSNNLMLLHFSDLHARVVNLERLTRFAERYKAITADVIGSGDLVNHLYSDDFAWWNSAFLVAIGNHDVWTTDTSNPNILDYQEGGFYVVKQKQVYDKFIAPFVSNWGVVQPSNASEIGACYYYKDYNSIRMIVLDSLHYGKGEDISSGSSAQDAWFRSILADARTKGKSVVVVSHYWGGAINEIDCSYNDMDSTSTDFISNLAPISVQEFIDNGGEFICWMCGHSHYDAIGTLKAYPQQIQIVVTNANNISAAHAQARAEGTKGQDAFNYIAFDTQEKLIKVVRIGADFNRLLQMKRRLVYKYSGDNQGLILCE